jgi:hypothetical protein
MPLKFLRRCAVITPAILMLAFVGACSEEQASGFCKQNAAICYIYFGVIVVTVPPEASQVMTEPANAPATDDVVVIGGADAKDEGSAAVEFYSPTTRAFRATGPLRASRFGSDPVALVGADRGLVLVDSGVTDTATKSGHNLKIPTIGIFRSAELYDLATGKTEATHGVPVVPRTFYTATVLKDGTVLIAGGIGVKNAVLASAEIFDPKTGDFKTTKGPMAQARMLHTATLLTDGTVLIAGGLSSATNPETLEEAEIYDPTTGLFTPTLESMPIGIAAHTATLISGCNCDIDGDVLLAGGFSGTAVENDQEAAFIYRASSRTFASSGVGKLHDARIFATATPLPSGEILFVGGMNGEALFEGGSNRKISELVSNGIEDTAEIFDPKTIKFTCVKGTQSAHCAASMVNSRAAHAAVLMTAGKESGQVLIAGGLGGKSPGVNGVPLTSAELYDIKTGKFTVTGSMHAAHVAPSAFLVTGEK